MQVSNPGTLPTGLAATTDYYLIRVDANTVKFASSRANALAGTAIDLTAAGAGTNTVEVNATIAGSVTLQKTNDPEGTNSPVWVDVTSADTFTATETMNFALNDKNLGAISFRALRLVCAVTSGQVTISARVNAKGA